MCRQVCLLGTLCARDTLIACSSSYTPAECVVGPKRGRCSVRVILRRIDRDTWMTKGGGNQRPWAGTRAQPQPLYGIRAARAGCGTLGKRAGLCRDLSPHRLL